MLPTIKIEEVTTRDGKRLALYQRGQEFSITIDDDELMSSRMYSSEQDLATLGCAGLSSSTAPRVLVGGLGMGYTLRAVLDTVPDDAQITVAEVFEEVIRWNEEQLGALAQYPLRDPRVRIVRRDVYEQLSEGRFQAILLDVDNGPAAMSVERNYRLYSSQGLGRLKAALAPGGMLAIWSAVVELGFLKKMQYVGLDARCEIVRGRAGGKGPRHAIFLGGRL